jgi:hypothetical protein
MNEELPNNTGGDSNASADDSAARKQAALDALAELGEAMRVSAANYDHEADQYWNSLPYDQQLMAFYSVCKRIYKGDLVDQGSYRHVLYHVFGFDPDAYIVGMECGYLDIHNAIVVDDADTRSQKIKDSFQRINNRYSETLERLAENERQERDSIGSEGGDVRGNDPSSDG